MSRAALQRLVLPAILLLALLLRLWGIGWGLPSSDHYWSYHPDESTVLALSKQVNPLNGQFDTGYYNYGAWHPICLSVILAFAQVFGLATANPVGSPHMAIPSGSEFLVARLYTVLLGVATCGLLSGIGRKLYSDKAGYLAALFYAITPLAVQHGHWATVDVAATFWVVLSLFFVSKFVKGEGKKPSVTIAFLLLAGLFAGYAAATKYNAGMVLLAAIAAGALTEVIAKKQKPIALFGTIALSGIGFVLGCPGVLLNTPKFIEGFQFEANHAKEGSGDIFVQTLPAFLHHLVINLPWAIGWPLAIIAIISIVQAIRRRQTADLVLLVFFIPYFILIGLAQVKFVRYLFPIIPVFLLWTSDFLTSEKAIKNKWGIILAAFGGVWALIMSCGFDQTMSSTDPRDKAVIEIRQTDLINTISFPTGPWYYHPPLHPLLSDWRAPLAQNAEPTKLRPSVSQTDNKPIEWDLSLLKFQEDNSTIKNDFGSNRFMEANSVVLSEFEYTDALRLSKPNAKEYLEYVKSTYPIQKIYASPIKFLGIPISSITEKSGLPVQSLPHDMLYTNPTVVFYTGKIK